MTADKFGENRFAKIVALEEMVDGRRAKKKINKI
jgi:hypothetical protein